MRIFLLLQPATARLCSLSFLQAVEPWLLTYDTDATAFAAPFSPRPTRLAGAYMISLFRFPEDRALSPGWLFTCCLWQTLLRRL